MALRMLDLSAIDFEKELIKVLDKQIIGGLF
jgi:hypothetical protein